MLKQSYLLVSVLVGTVILGGCSEKGEESSEHEVKSQPYVKAETVKKAQEAIKEAVASNKTGSALYATCAGCHGISGERKALGKSQVIKGWDSTKVYNALAGYKNGTYGGTMKGVMKSQVSALSDQDLKNLSKFISKL
ncbi:MAG: c-type cytochrome [Campylobacterota bacterium]|nr:c-type cytochrome [Campylobacterota bacterium]